MQMKQFKIGDEVKWTSASGGYDKTKRGKVVSVVYPGQDPGSVWRRIPPAAREGMSPMEWGLGDRDHESYLVAVQTGKTAKAKLRVYWPRVSALKAVTK